MSRSTSKLYEFGSFRLNTAERVLLRDDELMVLPPKVFDTLLVLVEKEGRVVSKSELMEAIWADAFVEESNLSQNIYTLRRTLGVDEQGKQFIETVPRRGYRFAAAVRSLDESPARDEEEVEQIHLEGIATHSRAEPLENSPASQSISHAANGWQASPTTEIQPLPPLTQAGSNALRYALFAGFGILIAAALVLGIYQLVAERGDTGQLRTSPIEQLRVQRLTDSGDVDSPTISPNGELLAYVRQEEQGESIWVKQIGTGSSFQTMPPSPKGCRSLAFSPDGRYLYFRDGPDPGTIYQTAAFGGPRRKLADNVWSDFSVSPDGKQFAFIRRDAARGIIFPVLANTDGSGERELGTSEPALSYLSNAPAWSPDGARIVVATGAAKLLAISTATGEETKLVSPNWRAIFNTLWMPNGNYLIVSAREINESTSQLWMVPYPNGEIRRLTNDLENYLWVSLSADGRMLVTRQRSIILHLSLVPDSDNKKARELTFGRRNMDGFYGLAWTPENRIVFSNVADNSTDIHSMNADGGNRVQLTTNAGSLNNHPAVSRDGRYILFTSNRSGTPQIWRMDTDGRNQKQLTFAGDQREYAQFAALSPDGAEVFFIRSGVGPAAIWKVSIEGGTPVPISHLTDALTEGYLSISPDGKWLAYRHVSVPGARTEDFTMRIGLLPTDGKTGPRLLDLPMRRSIIHWSSDSTALYYAAGAFNSSSIWRHPLDGSNPQKLLDFPDRILNFAWSPDWKNLVVSHGKEQGDALLITNLP
jgi:Tol biopolymer transport system component/DNA-binding winged helix-turn-helix (wHTH) protein